MGNSRRSSPGNRSIQPYTTSVWTYARKLLGRDTLRSVGAVVLRHEPRNNVVRQAIRGQRARSGERRDSRDAYDILYARERLLRREIGVFQDTDVAADNPL